MSIRTARDLGAAIKQARMARGLSQSTLARKVGVHQPKISEVEKGAPSVRVGLVLQILRALDLVVTIEKDEPATPRRHRWPSDEVDLDKIANTGLD